MLEALGVELIGAGLDAIRRAEDRELFRDAVRSVGLRVPESRIVTSLDELEGVALPAVVRPAFTLGGHGGGFASTADELRRQVEIGLRESPIGQVLVEESVRGWDEFELEVMRDALDNVVVVCSIENLDPMGVHTGDSVTVAPQMTLSDEAYQELRDAAAAVIRAVGVECGGSNIQFARDRETGDIRVIEMNPRVSRSSALASKATGYPIAKVAAKLAVGYTLDEIPNDLTRTTPASFEPTLDYVVVKFPRFAFEKFPGADTTLGTQMKSVGEAMGIGRTFAEAFAKAMESRELDRGAVTPWSDLDDLPEGLHPWFRAELESLRLRQGRARLPPRRLRRRRGARRLRTTTTRRSASGTRRCRPRRKPRVVVLGSGPNRIGQGIEFDYCCVHAAQAFRSLGYEAVMVNCNPETVSTDYDTSDRLYFEPLTEEYVLAVCEREQPDGVVIQFGGQTPLKLAHALDDAGFRSSARRSRRSTSRRTASASRASSPSTAFAARSGGSPTTRRTRSRSPSASAIPVLVRPSYVLGGRAMRVCYRAEQVRRGVRGRAARPDARRPLPRRRPGDRRRRALRRAGDVRGGGDGARGGGGRPLRRLVVRAARAVSRRGTGRGRRGARVAARAGARSDRSRQRPAGARRRRDLGAGGEPARVAHRAVREQGDGRQSRRGGLPADGRRAAGVARAAQRRRAGDVSVSRRPSCRSPASPAPTRCSARRCAPRAR